ncbi:MAG: ABC transporter permease subunit [Planctomycetia bacterium]|nr:ABC transporter permease subunit [Planctomycetia bacterium]
MSDISLSPLFAVNHWIWFNFETLKFVLLYLAGALVLPLGIWVVLKLPFPRAMQGLSAIAGNTAQSVMKQPIFAILLIFGLMAILLFPWIPYNTLGEDAKIMKSQGLTVIKVLGILLAVWSAGTAISEEIEEKTALTLLSKPISRRQLLIGKFLGIILGVSIFFTVLSTVFMPTCSMKVVHDARENCLVDPETSACVESMVTTVPGLALSFMEIVMMTAVTVALATRLPMVPNLTLCTTIYALGHLIPLMVKSSIGQFQIVGFVGNLLSAILPVLSYFSLETTVGGGATVSMQYLLGAAAYCFLYSLVALFFALILFEDRDLA